MPNAPFNGLSDAEAERLALLLEELGEAQQAVGKILRHGYESFAPSDPEGPTNRQQLQTELGDVLTAIGIMDHHGDISKARIELRVSEKNKKVWRYLHHNQAPS